MVHWVKGVRRSFLVEELHCSPLVLEISVNHVFNAECGSSTLKMWLLAEFSRTSGLQCNSSTRKLCLTPFTQCTMNADVQMPE